jgi:Putative peptidoglycan binding domain
MTDVPPTTAVPPTTDGPPMADGDEIPATPPPDGYVPPSNQPNMDARPISDEVDFNAAIASLAQVHAIEIAQIGVAESPPGSNNNKFTAWYPMPGAPWCDISQSWIFTAAGDPMHFALCSTHIAACKQAGVWHQGHAGIALGDLVFYDWNADGFIDHIEWVESVNQVGIVTLGGNVSDRFDRWSRGFGPIVGYGRPFYAEGTPLSPAVHPMLARPVPILEDGSTGPQVRALQSALNRFGAHLAVDGGFGTQTGDQLENFQRFMGLVTDRQYGQLTAGALDMALKGQGV